MNYAILGVILVYTLTTIVLGLWTRERNVDSSEDYYVASRSVSWFHLGITVVATWFSTFSFLGAPGFFFTKGVKWYAPYAFYTFAGVILFWLVSRKIWELGKKGGYITPADLLCDFYQSPALRYVVGIICLLSLFPYALIQLVGIGKAIEVATGGFASYEAVVLATGVVTAFYVYVGGVRAILWTDLIQGALFSLVIFVGMFVAIYAAGGLFSGFAEAGAKYPELFVFEDGDTIGILSVMLTWSLGFVTLPHLWQRAYMARSAEHLVKTSVFVGLVGIFLITALMITGVLGMSFMAAGGDSDKFIVNMFSDFFPYALPLFVLAVFASGMSTVDSQLLTASSIFVRDLVKPFKPDLKTTTERKLGQGFLVALISALTFIALLPEAQGPIIALATKGTALAVMLFIPLLGPTYLPGANKYAALTALSLGSLYYVLADVGVIEQTFGLTPFLAALALNLILFLGFTISSKVSEKLRELSKSGQLVAE